MSQADDKMPKAGPDRIADSALAVPAVSVAPVTARPAAAPIIAVLSGPTNSVGSSGPVVSAVSADPGPVMPVLQVPVEAQRLSALEELLAGYLASKRSKATRDAYSADLRSWISWCTDAGVEVLAAGIHHADVYLRALADPDLGGDPTTGRVLAASSIGRPPRPSTGSTATPPATTPCSAPRSPASPAPPPTTSPCPAA